MKSKRATSILFLIIIAGLFLNPVSPPAREGFASTAQQGTYLSPEEYETLDEMFQVHINYFLSPEVITAFGFPLTAYKVEDRARYGYSNPTEWGYALQAWIAAAERGIISQAEAVNRISMALTTMQALQQDPDQNYQGLFYPYYTMTDKSGNDLPSPFHDADHWIPSSDNALLYASLLITQGWARSVENASLESRARSVGDDMSFRMFLFEEEGETYLAHQIHADTGELSSSKWDVFADEGGVVTWIAYFAGSVTFEEFRALTESQVRYPATWRSCLGKTYTVKECAWFNAMFAWGVRSLAGFPISSFDAPVDSLSLYSRDSFVHAVEAHLAYGDCLGVDYPAFSDAMTQSEGGEGLVGRYTPPNCANEAPDYPPEHAVPHAFFVPFNAGPDLGSLTRTDLISNVVQLSSDQAGYYHDSGPYSFGFEVVVSPDQDNMSYDGADDGRNVFETLSEAYTVLSVFNALQLNNGGSTFYTLAACVPGYESKVRQVLEYLYPFQTYLPFITRNRPWCVVGEYRFGSGSSPHPEERSITIDESCVEPGENMIVLENASYPPTDHWLIWDSLSLEAVLGGVIWELGENEAPPDYSQAAYDEFDQDPPYNSDFCIGQMSVSDFSKELNDSNLTQVSIHFNLAEEQANNDLVLFLDTLYATHSSVPYFDMRVKVRAGNGECWFQPE